MAWQVVSIPHYIMIYEQGLISINKRIYEYISNGEELTHAKFYEDKEENKIMIKLTNEEEGDTKISIRKGGRTITARKIVKQINRTGKIEPIEMDPKEHAIIIQCE